MTLFLKLALILACFQECMSDERIVGGMDAYEGQIPYIVSLRTKNNAPYCGGSIIDNRWILTAAHCIKEIIPPHVVAGSIDLSLGTRYNIIKNIIHEKYVPETFANDIALLKTDISIEFNAYVKPIPLGFDRIGANVEMLVSGWGLTSFPGVVSTTLKVLKTSTISNEACQSIMQPKEIFDHVMCEFKSADQGLCKGDSGGPHVANGKLYGISSWVVPCGVGKPDGATRVSSFILWIFWTKITNFF